MIKLTLRLVDLRLSLQVLRVLRHRYVRVAVEFRQLGQGLLAERFELVFVEFERETCLIVACLGDVARRRQRGITVISHLVEFDLRLLGGGVAEHLV